MLLSLAIAGCSKDVVNPAPPRVSSEVRFPQQTSTLVVPITTSLDGLERALDAKTPRTLWRIDERRSACVKAERVNVGIARIKVTPDLPCRIIGEAVRGKITLSGTGDEIDIMMPVTATIAVRNLAGVVHETATGNAAVHATARLSIAGDWRPSGVADIHYRWMQKPGITIPGQRITFAGKADEKLRPVIATLQRNLPQELAKLNLRSFLQEAWSQAFTTIMLNRRKPPAWMRITPRALGYGGYRVEGRTLRLLLSAEALTETFVTDTRPANPVPTALPPPRRIEGVPGFRFYAPVLADYAQLEPVVQRTLRKLAAKGISLEGIGAVDAEFGKVTIYATANGRLAVGVQTRVKARALSFGAATGEAWLTALPFNKAGSQLVDARDVTFAAQTDNRLVNLVVALFSDSAVQASIAKGLRHDFAPDFNKVIRAAEKAVGHKREKDFVISTRITTVRNGRIMVTGAGLFMPVEASGTAQINYRPRQ